MCNPLLEQLASATNPLPIRIIFMGNSRVARPIGFASGMEQAAYDLGRRASGPYGHLTVPNLVPNTLWRQGEGKVIIGELGHGGYGYPKQVSELIGPEELEDFAFHVTPDIVIWQYAANQGPTGVADATLELMSRMDWAVPGNLHILLQETPVPKANFSIQKRADSAAWILEVQASRPDVLSLDVNPYLPIDYISLEETEFLGQYFTNSTHENILGAKTVGSAIFTAIQAICAP